MIHRVVGFRGKEATVTKGSTLLVAERRQELLDTVRTHGRLEVARAASELRTSTETIRKDLVALESQGLLRRVHGGALQVPSMTFEPDVVNRTEDLEEKGRIAARALGEVPAEGTIFIDAGSTTLAFAELLEGRAGLRVFTNSLTVARIVAGKPFLSCHTLGGRVRPNTLAEVGSWTERLLDDSHFHFDVAFVGTNAISFSRGLCTPDPEEAAVKRGMIVNSERVVLLADHTKFGQNSLVKYADLAEIDLVVTGVETEGEHRRALTDAGVETALA
jgi:DeoR family fructose operon transcriptional repressor